LRGRRNFIERTLAPIGGHVKRRIGDRARPKIDGVIHDTHDPSRNGTRFVYGYWQHLIALA
jgi:hypothetical protein